MRCWGELKSLKAQSGGQCVLVMRAVFKICGNESQPGLQRVEKLVRPLHTYRSQIKAGNL